jgi:hypothetical protein
VAKALPSWGSLETNTVVMQALAAALQSEMRRVMISYIVVRQALLHLRTGALMLIVSQAPVEVAKEASRTARLVGPL